MPTMDGSSMADLPPVSQNEGLQWIMGGAFLLLVLVVMACCCCKSQRTRGFSERDALAYYDPDAYNEGNELAEASLGSNSV